MVRQFFHDLRFAVRALRGARVVTAVTVLTLGIGIGLLTAIFSLVNAAILRPLPFDESSRLVALTEAHPRVYPAFSAVSPAAFAEVRARSRSFDGIAAYARASGNVVLEDNTERLSGVEVSPDLFSLLRVPPIRGRVFTADEMNADARVLVISHELWTTRFGASESIVGSTLRVDGVPFTVVGVMAPGFNFPARDHFWRPLARLTDDGARTERSLAVAARLRDGVSLGAARAEVATIGVAFARANPSTHDGWSLRVQPELLERRAIPGPLPWMVLAAGLFTLLIACANVATVLLARAATRRGEMAIRAALGASRGRLVAQHLSETLVLAIAGGIAGVVIAQWMLDATRASLPLDNMPSWLDFGVDWRVLAFTLGAALLTLAGVGIGPALTATRVRLSDTLKLGAVGETASRKELRASRALVVAEVALAFVLFAGSALMVQSFRKLRAFDFGIDASHVLTARPLLARATYSTVDRRAAYFAQASERVTRLPGVGAVATSGVLDSLRGAAWASDSGRRSLARFALVARGEGDALSTPGVRTPFSHYVVSAEYFDVVGLGVTRGRGFTAIDGEGGARVAVLSDAVVRALWPGVDPLGRQFRFGASAEWITVVGVVRDVQRMTGGPRGATGRAEAAVYLPTTQATSANDVVLARTAGDPLALAPAVVRVLRELDRDQAITRVQRLSDEMGSSADSTLWLGMIFAAIATGALALASIGLYGVIAYAVSRRTREIGVRMALGADARALRRSVVVQALRLTGAGLVIGAAGSWGLVRLMGSFLYGVTAYDPFTYAAVAILFLTLGVIASVVPARRATRVDPLIALRAQ